MKLYAPLTPTFAALRRRESQEVAALVRLELCRSGLELPALGMAGSVG